MSRGKAKKPWAEIVSHRGEDCVCVIFPDGRKDWPRMTQQGIQYEHPERIPRFLKQGVVPELFKQLRARRLGN